MKRPQKFRSIGEVYTTGIPYEPEEIEDKPFKPLSEAYHTLYEAPVDLQATKQAKADILTNPGNSQWGFEDMSNPRRLANRGKLDSEDFLTVLHTVFGLGSQDVQVLDPRQNPNPSSKFNMFIYMTPAGKEIQIVLAGGGNAGEDYEQMITTKLQQYIKAEAGDPVLKSEVSTVFDKLDIDPELVKSIQFAGATDTKRALDFDDGPINVGKTIADVVIEMETEEEQQIIDRHYISIKNKKGDTIYNGGNIPFIIANGDIPQFDQNIFDGTDHPSKQFFEIFNIDLARCVNGLRQYAQKISGESDDTGPQEDGKWEEISLPNDNLRLIRNGLASAWGFGYWYLREKGKDIVFEPVLNAADAYDRVGDISKVMIKYPYKRAKQLTIQVVTDGQHGTSKYDIAMRNTSGKFLPWSTKIVQH